jgi:hypothetical protein
MYIEFADGTEGHFGFRHGKGRQVPWTQGYTDWSMATASLDGRTGLVTAHAFRNPKDRPNRIVARKVALARLLKRLDWPKSKRAEVWEAFKSKGMRL